MKTIQTMCKHVHSLDYTTKVLTANLFAGLSFFTFLPQGLLAKTKNSTLGLQHFVMFGVSRVRFIR